MFKVGNLVRFRTRGGFEKLVVVLGWEASLEWVEDLFSDGKLVGPQWVATHALEVVSESR